MIHAKNKKAWFVKSHAPQLGGRVIIVRGPVTCLRVVLAVPIVPGTGIATNRRVAIAALQYKFFFTYRLIDSHCQCTSDAE